MSNHSSISWREWGEDAFAEAKAADKPILLDIGAVWCHWCHVMDTGIPGDPVHTGTYSDPAVQERIAKNFIPIKVDNDRRPDINARYNMGGWPTTAFLTPDGDTLYGETYVAPSRMVGLLDYMANVYADQKDQIAEQAAEMREQRAKSEALTPSELDPNTTANVLKSIAGQFDPVYGGFGSQPKFPHPDALRLVLEEYARTQDPAQREIAEKTLHGMADGGHVRPVRRRLFPVQHHPRLERPALRKDAGRQRQTHVGLLPGVAGFGRSLLLGSRQVPPTTGS